MNMQQVVHPRHSNGSGRRSKSDNKFQTGKANSSRASFGKGGGLESSSCDRLIYLTTCLIGQQVEVQVQDGSVISGLFHATNAEDFAIVLKMAHVIKDGSRGQNNVSEVTTKPPARTFIVQAKDLVQVIAKGVPVTRDGLTNELQNEKQQELMTDSCISQSRHVEVGRELEPWVPDKNDPVCPELENIFDGPWNRGWDQFEANATLFGVRSTFNEELYTTKLERGPQMRELEREATRLAREIEGEETLDLHLAEERGIQLDENLEVDEETRFSSVCRRVDDSGYDEVENILLDSRNEETFGDVSSSVIGKPSMDLITRKTSDGTQTSLRSSFMGEMLSSLTTISRDAYHSGSEDDNQNLLTEQLLKQPLNDAIRVHDNQSIGHAESRCTKEDKDYIVLDQSRTSKAEDSNSLSRLKNERPDKVVLSPNATSFDPSHASSKDQENVSSSNERSEGVMPLKTQGTTSSIGRPMSCTSDCEGPTSTSAGRGLSPSSSVGSLSSEKSMLNPHAKEFKFNPKAKSFVPTTTPLRPSSPVAESPFYYPANLASLTQMHGMPVGIGMGPSFAPQQPVMFNPQAAQMPQQYYHPNGPQMMIGQPRPVLYMPSYPNEMPYKGREF